jgi:hypothetical protein
MEAHRPSRAVAACAEFPNDNPALHRGAIWCCVEIGGDAVCEPAVEMRDIVACAVTEPTPTERIALMVHDAPLPAAPAQAADPAIEPVPETGETKQPEQDDDPMEGAAADRGAADEDAADEDATDEDAAVKEAAVEEATDEEPIEVVDNLEFDEAMVDGSAAQDLPVGQLAVADDPFATLVRVMEEVSRAAGCSEETVRCVRALLGAARLDGDAVPGACAGELLAAGVLVRCDRGLVRAESFARQVVGWQGVLSGQSEDFDACGPAMLDEWCANLLARAMGNASRAEGLRRELRRRGVAAFGLVADAA